MSVAESPNPDEQIDALLVPLHFKKKDLYGALEEFPVPSKFETLSAPEQEAAKRHIASLAAAVYTQYIILLAPMRHVSDSQIARVTIGDIRSTLAAKATDLVHTALLEAQNALPKGGHLNLVKNKIAQLTEYAKQFGLEI